MEFLSYDPWANVVSRNGYTADELREGIHKTIRRNNVQLAMRISYEMYITSEQMEEMLWRRLCIISVEDFGMADPMAPVVIDTLNRLRKQHPYNDIDRHTYAIQAIRYLCAAPKDLTDGIQICVIRKEFERGILPEIPPEAYDMHCKKGREMGKEMDDFLQEGNVVNPASEIYKSEEYKELEKVCLAMTLEEKEGHVEKKPLEVAPFETACYFI